MTRRAKSSLAREIMIAYLATRWHMRRGALRNVVMRLREVDPSPLRQSIGPEQGARLGRAVTRTLSTLPTDSRCLVRSLVLLRLLARRGVSASLVIAARPGAADGLHAHAWVEMDGMPVLPPARSDYGRLVTI